MKDKTCVPYDRSGEPREGSSVIHCKVYGRDRCEVVERHNAAKKENQMIGEATPPAEQGSQWVIMWKEKMPTLADVICPVGWNRRPMNKGQSR